MAAEFDLTGDGTPDLVRSMPDYQNNNIDDPATIYSGPLDSLDLTQPVGQLLQAGSRNFREVAVGDVTGDGVADLIWGCRQCPTGFGFWPGPISGTTDVNERALEVRRSPVELISGTPSIGDVNGDGIADLMVSIEVYERGGVPRTDGLLFLGPLSGAPLSEADADMRLTSRHTLDRVEIVGDMTGDGLGDFLAKAEFPRPPQILCSSPSDSADYINVCSGYSGSIYIVDGTSRGEVDVDAGGVMVTTAGADQVDTSDTFNPSLPDELIEPGQLSWLRSHAYAGDVDGDGVGDLFLQTEGTAGTALLLVRGCGAR
jgi:hypothetical protein